MRFRHRALPSVLAAALIGGLAVTPAVAGVIRGTNGDDVLRGTDGRDRIDGRGGADRIAAGARIQVGLDGAVQV